MKSGGEEKVMTFSSPMTRENICFCIPKHGVFVKNPNINHFFFQKRFAISWKLVYFAKLYST